MAIGKGSDALTENEFRLKPIEKTGGKRKSGGDIVDG